MPCIIELLVSSLCYVPINRYYVLVYVQCPNKLLEKNDGQL